MKPRLQSRSPLVLLAAVLVFGGAGPLPAGSPKHEVRVEALCRDPERTAVLHSYVIRPVHPNPDEHSLRHREAVAHLRTALSGLGLFEAPAGVRPDLVIAFDCGLGAPRTVYVETTEPVYEVQDGPGAGLTTRVPENARRAWLVGYATVKRPVQVRDKYLTVAARANPPATAEAAPAADLWRVSVRIEDASDELRGYLPVLAAAVMDQAGFTTEGNVALTVAANSEAVAFIRRGF
jgi:hypothetical protein